MWHLIAALTLWYAGPPMEADRFIELTAELPVAGIERVDSDAFDSGDRFKDITDELMAHSLTQAQFDVLAYQLLDVLEHPETPNVSCMVALTHLVHRMEIDGRSAWHHSDLTYGASTSLKRLASRDREIPRRLAALLDHEVYTVRTNALLALGACSEFGEEAWPDMLRVPVRSLWGMGGDPSLEIAFLTCGDVCLPFLIDAVERGDPKAGRVVAFLSAFDERAARVMQSLPWEHELTPHRLRANVLILIYDAPHLPSDEEIVECLRFGEEDAVEELMSVLLQWSAEHDDGALARDVRWKLLDHAEHDLARKLKHSMPGLFAAPTTKPREMGSLGLVDSSSA